MIIFNYSTKKELKQAIGTKLEYIETSMFGAEYLSNGKLTGCNRPHMTGHKREFFANATIKDDIIIAVS